LFEVEGREVKKQLDANKIATSEFTVKEEVLFAVCLALRIAVSRVTP
jgi:hypothetical protein